MKAVQIQSYSKKLEAHINDVPIPRINKHQVLIKTNVAGVDPTSCIGDYWKIGSGFLVSPNTFSILNRNNQYSLKIPTEEVIKLKKLGRTVL
ncbi:hypothetical protein SC499_06125 [Peribacillus simplex]|uniref:hypothetical protein n=1 Tax=Peribacillus simplex TaxID=1478 RepID=UPI00298E2FF5|nr:hypothetical protein [Peribacillus simplex]MDW7614312.1 hypothetical protein [Peribacillus simplex]